MHCRRNRGCFWAISTIAHRGAERLPSVHWTHFLFSLHWGDQSCCPAILKTTNYSLSLSLSTPQSHWVECETSRWPIPPPARSGWLGSQQKATSANIASSTFQPQGAMKNRYRNSVICPQSLAAHLCSAECHYSSFMHMDNTQLLREIKFCDTVIDAIWR